MASKKNYTGPESYRQLRKELQDKYANATPIVPNPTYSQPADFIYDGPEQSYLYKNTGGQDFWGNSWFDEGNPTEEVLNGDSGGIEEVRAQNQPWYAKVGAGIGKAITTAGTTFLSGTLGLLYGAGAAINQGSWSGIWDNDLSKGLNDFNETMEKILPNYYSQEELNTPWYSNIFTANFLGDKLIKNLGFSIGAFYSGGLATKALQGISYLNKLGVMALRSGNVIKTATAMKAIQGINNTTKALSAWGGSLYSAVGEGSVEAINNSKEWANNEKAKAYELFQDGKLSAEQYHATLAKIEEDRPNMGNMDLLMNIPLLTVGNFIQFGRAYARGKLGIKTNLNIKGKPGEYATSVTKGSKIWAGAKGFLTEGQEELHQRAAGTIAGKYYDVDVNNFIRAQMDPKAEQETLDGWKAFTGGLAETYGDVNAWEEFFIGGLTGLLGIPIFRNPRSKGKWRSPIEIQGGIFNEISEINKRQADEERIADYMNKRFKDPNFRNYYQGLLRHNAYENAMEKAVGEDDDFDYHNAKNAQLTNDINMFAKAGKLADLQAMIEGALDTSDENLESIFKNTSKQNEKGEWTGIATTPEGNPVYDTPEGKQGLIDRLKKNKQKILDKIKEVALIRDQLLDKLPANADLTDDQENELVYMQSQINNYKKRTKTLAKKARPAFRSQLETVQDEIEKIEAQLGSNPKYSIKKGKGLFGKLKEAFSKKKEEKGVDTSKKPAQNTTQQKSSESNNAQQASTNNNSSTNSNSSSQISEKERAKLVEKLAKLKAVRDNLTTLISKNDEDLGRILSDPENNEMATAMLAGELSGLSENPNISDETMSVITGLNDLVRIGKAKKQFQEKFDEYVGNPSKQAKDHEKIKQEESAKRTVQKTKSFKDELSGIKNAKEFGRIYNNSQLSDEEKQNTLDSLIKDGSSIAREYKDYEDYKREVRYKLSDMGLQGQSLQDAYELFIAHSDAAESLSDLLNSNSTTLTNTSFFRNKSADDAEASQRFLNAQYNVQRAMGLIAEDNKFKKRFVKPHKVATQPSTPSTPPSTPPTGNPPVGNISSEELAGEFEEQGKRDTGQTQKGKKLYYRPAIPEVHIEASKEGDFRTFAEVVLEREGSHFEEIYDYLEKAGAFQFVKDGKLKPGDDLVFMIDPEFEEQVKDKKWHTEPVIFIVHQKTGAVVGSLDSGQSVANFAGLAKLRQDIIDEYNASRKPSRREEISEPKNFNDRFDFTVTFGERSQHHHVEAGKVSVDKNGIITITFKDKINDSVKGERVLEDGKGVIRLSLNDIDLAKYAESNDPEDISEAEERILNLLINPLSNGSRKTSIKAFRLVLSPDGRIFADLKTIRGTTRVPIKTDSEIVTKIKDFIEVDSVEKEIDSTPESELIQITYTGQDLHQVHETNEWNGRIVDTRGTRAGWEIIKGLWSFNLPMQGGRGNENMIIWFKEKPSAEFQKFFYENLIDIIQSTNNNKEISKEIASLVREDLKEKFLKTLSALDNNSSILNNLEANSNKAEKALSNKSISLDSIDKEDTKSEIPDTQENKEYVRKTREELEKKIAEIKKQLPDNQNNLYLRLSVIDSILPIGWKYSEEKGLQFSGEKLVTIHNINNGYNNIKLIKEGDIVDVQIIGSPKIVRGVVTEIDDNGTIQEVIDSQGIPLISLSEIINETELFNIQWAVKEQKERERFSEVLKEAEKVPENKVTYIEVTSDNYFTKEHKDNEITEVMQNDRDATTFLRNVSNAYSEEIAKVLEHLDNPDYDSTAEMKELSKKLPIGIELNEKGLFLSSALLVNAANIDNPMNIQNPIKVGNRICIYSEGFSNMHYAVVTKVDNKGFIIEAIDEHGIAVIKDGKILSEDRINEIGDALQYVKLPESKPVQTKKSTEGKTFISSKNTKVGKIMVGKLAYTQEEKSLNDIPNVKKQKSSGRIPQFAIVKNGVLVTASNISQNDIMPLQDISNKEGRLYLLVPNGAGKYSPAAVRVKHFNTEEFNLNDETVANTAVGKKISKAIEKLAKVENDDDLEEAVAELSKVLYKGDNVHIDYINSNGGGIRINKAEVDAEGNEIYDINEKGEKVRRETTKTVYFAENSEVGGEFDDNGNFIPIEPAAKTTSEKVKELIDALLYFNLPIQVNISDLGNTTVFNDLISSNVLTSNLKSAETVGDWFVTDYFDDEGNRQNAVPPVAKAPVPPTGNPVVKGTPLTINGEVIHVDVGSGMIYDKNGARRATDADQLLIDLALAQNYYGDKTEGISMINNCVVLRSGKVLDRTRQKYLEGEEADKIKKALNDRNNGNRKKGEEIVAQIKEDQKKVDRSRTDSEAYYILEDDDEYHAYDRVHKRTGSNWNESAEQKQIREEIEKNLTKVLNDKKRFNDGLDYYSKKFNVDLSSVRDKNTTESISTVINLINSALIRKRSSRALEAGNSVDNIGRQVFMLDDLSKITKPDNLSQEAFNTLISAFSNIKTQLVNQGYQIFTDNLVLYKKYPDGTRVAGEVDMLLMDKNGNFYIYDFKTSAYPFGSFTHNGKVVNFFENQGPNQNKSTKEQYTLQLSAYKNLFESKYDAKVKGLALLPFTLEYDTNDKNKVNKITVNPTIKLTYNPAVAVPLVNPKEEAKGPKKPKLVLPQEDTSNLSIFDATNERLDPESNLSDVVKFNTKGSKEGYYELNGKVYKGDLLHIGSIAGIPIHLVKLPVTSQGQTLKETVDNGVVFPNGKTVIMARNVYTNIESEQEGIPKVMAALSQKPEKVKAYSSEKTLLQSETPPSGTNNGPVEVESTNNGAQAAVQAEQAIKAKAGKNRSRPRLREATSENKSNRSNTLEEELKVLEEILPQLSREERIEVINDYIRVLGEDTLAWGKVENGIMTLSKLAEKGTVYHEAFHIVFNYLIDSSERAMLLAEVKKKHGSLSDIDLEEIMAEEFRKFQMNVVSEREVATTWGQKILRFFKRLLNKIKMYNKIGTSRYALYQAISNGEYANKKLNVSDPTLVRTQKEEFTDEMKEILKNAPRDAEGYLLAPNGKRSNLNERQWAQVRTKAFRNWFGDWMQLAYDKKTNDFTKTVSKVVDENGEPLVVYHGGNPAISIFKPGGSNTSNGYYVDPKTGERFNTDSVNTMFFSSSKSVAQSYAVFLNIKNPLSYDYEGTQQGQGFKQSKTPFGYVAARQTKKALKEGNDGVIYQNIIDPYLADNYGVFNSNQIKSATDNNGEFSATTDDIRYRIVDDQSIDAKESKNKELLEDLKSFFSNFGISIRDVSKFDSEEPLFNALDRVINYKSIEDLTDNAGYALAFMMQYSPKIRELINLKTLNTPVALKGLRRGIKKHGDYKISNLTDSEYKHLDKTPYLKEIGMDIAEQLRALYLGNPINTSDSFLKKIWQVITEFFDLLTPSARAKFNISKNYTKSIANAIKLGDYTIVRFTDNKPGTTEKAELVDIGKALKENPYEESIISIMNDNGIALAGGAAIASQGSLFRPSENPLHDLDFQATNHSKEQIEDILAKNFKAYSLTSTIQDRNSTTLTYLVLDREFEEKRETPGVPIYTIYDKNTGEKIGTRMNSELVITKEGVKGKMLDFFTGKNDETFIDNITVSYNGKSYLFSDYRNAMQFKIKVAREKDLWDYNRFIPRDNEGNLKSLLKLKNESKQRAKKLIEKAHIVWGHPAIGKTTYLENNQDIIEWDQEVNPKRNKFIRDQIDPNHKMDITSKEYKELRSQYMNDWQQHQEYIDFLTKEWQKLKDRAAKENKRLFASPLPLLSLFADDFDLVVALPEKQFKERDLQRGNSEFGSTGWKQLIDQILVSRVNPSKLVYTTKYFSEFMRDNLGVQWGTLTKEEAQSLQAKGWTKEEFDKQTQAVKDSIVECL